MDNRGRCKQCGSTWVTLGPTPEGGSEIVCIDCGHIERSDDGIIPVTAAEVEALHDERQSVPVREAAYAVV